MTGAARRPRTAEGERGGSGSDGGGAARPHTAFNGADGPRAVTHTRELVTGRARGGRPVPPSPRPAGQWDAKTRRIDAGNVQWERGSAPAPERPLRPNESSEDTAAKCRGGLEGASWGWALRLGLSPRPIGAESCFYGRPGAVQSGGCGGAGHAGRRRVHD